VSKLVSKDLKNLSGKGRPFTGGHTFHLPVAKRTSGLLRKGLFLYLLRRGQNNGNHSRTERRTLKKNSADNLQ